MKLLAALLLLFCACEHDPRYERHRDYRRPPPAAQVPVDAAGSDKTVERHGVDVPPLPPGPRIVPLDKRTHRRHR